MKSGVGDYHLLVAHNFLSNISLDGSHEDTKLRMFNRRQGEQPDLTVKAPLAEDDASVSIECVDEDEVPLLEAGNLCTSAAGRSGSPTSSFFSATSTRKTKPLKKLSALKRFVRMVSADDVIAERGYTAEEKIALGSLSGPKRKSETSERASMDDRPASPASITQFTFLRRLRTSLAKGERSLLCTSSGAPLIVISHLPFQSSARARSRLRHSRSSIGSSERLNTAGASVEELRPFDFKETEYVHFEQLGWKLRRSSLSAGGVAWRSPSKEERRASGQQSTTLNPASVASVTSKLSTGSRGDFIIEEDSYELDSEITQRNDYDPAMIDDILSATRTVIRCNGFIGVTKKFAPPQVNKATLNETFAEKFPHVHLTYSKLRSIKRDIWQIANECEVDEYTVAQAFVYFERIVVKGLISKNNRKIVAGAALLVAVKLNDYKKPDIVKVLECAEEKLRISRREILSFELPLCSALQFDLFPPAHHVEPHVRKIMFKVF